MISINTIRDRKGPFRANDWMMDSGGFTELSTHGRWWTSPQQYADEINRYWLSPTKMEIARPCN
jgi:hypothetical protein